MATFSERYNHTESRTVVQRESLDELTRIALWNLFYEFNEKLPHFYPASAYPQRDLARLIWADYLEKPLDEYSTIAETWRFAKHRVLKSEWYEACNFMEFLLAANKMKPLQVELARTLNLELEAKLTGYRLIDRKVVPVDSEAESAAISEALDDATSEPLSGVRHHLITAINKLADRAKPDYPNSVKESISAVEAMLELITKESVLSKALPKLTTSGVTLHPAQLAAWKSLYGWTSDEDGVRHSAKAPPNVDQATAKYMLATCSAFVSWLIEAARKANVPGLT
jgi:hypothetical protein